jgi:glucose/arabinose dehydrogenase
MFRTASLLSAVVGLTFAAAFAAPAAAQVGLTTTRVASGLAQPVFVTAPPGDTNRLFIVEQGSSGSARIKVLDLGTGVVSPTLYLTLSGIAAGGEQGLLGLAFHPDFASNGYLYVDYTNAAGSTVIARYTANAPYATSTSVDPASATTLITILQPFSNHNGGWIGFGPDRYLYIAMGDGGSGGDPGNRAQTITNQLLGKMLRIDVNGDDFPADATRNYAIPPTNPFVGIVGDDEIWFYGLRNPWRDSFDRLTGQMYIGDVGQGAIEEVDVAAAGVGGLNFGWRCMEGTQCTGSGGCTCNSPALTLPVHQYTHSSGCSITGGYVYRGTALCGVQGTYFYSDYCSATITSFRFNGTTVTNVTNRTSELAPGGGLAINSVSSFGEDASGELYICDHGGEIFKIVPRLSGADCNGNSIVDACDIQSGTSLDANTNGVPDECEYSITPICFGDGTGTPCPCGNVGTTGNGCSNSLNAAGAHLAGLGVPSASNDSFLLVGTGMTNGAVLYFQGTAQIAGGSGSVFGDGKRCAGGTVVRLGTKQNVGGSSSYPEILDPLISIRGGITGGPQTRTYQCWYRNADPTFCTADTFNLSNGVTVVWVN